MFKSASLLLDTIKHLRFKQLKYQLYYKFKKVAYLGNYCIDSGFTPRILEFRYEPPTFKTAFSNGKFVFLNLEADFNDKIDWNFQKYGKLWNYNLQYANFLSEDNISIDTRIAWIKSIYEALSEGSLKLEPYPASLRIINVIKFLCRNEINDVTILNCLYGEINFLSKRLEFHLMGNHLLENGFALCIGSAFFNNDDWKIIATELLISELNEQILEDGGHFELSPMYHQIILFRILELVDWYSNWEKKSIEFELLLHNKAAYMLSWIKLITFQNGDIPLFNDSASGLTYSTATLIEYARKLGIGDIDIPLGESGYRSYNRGKYECKVDIGPIGASYQPGHGHSDSLGFLLYYNCMPFLVEAGTSTYEDNEQRQLERSTMSHNTLVLENQNQSIVYGAFRVANRANCELLNEGSDYILAENDGYYSRFKVKFQRAFNFRDDVIIIEDKVIGNINVEPTAFFHLHPSLQFEILDNKILIENVGEIVFKGSNSIIPFTYSYALEFNSTQSSTALKVSFNESLTTFIKFI